MAFLISDSDIGGFGGLAFFGGGGGAFIGGGGGAFFGGGGGAFFGGGGGLSATVSSRASTGCL